MAPNSFLKRVAATSRMSTSSPCEFRNLSAAAMGNSRRGWKGHYSHFGYFSHRPRKAQGMNLGSAPYSKLSALRFQGLRMIPLTLAKTIAAAALACAALISGCAGGPLANGGPPRNDDVFNRIQPGMTRDEVQRLIGLPDETMRFPLSNTISWDYQYQ